MVSEHSIYRHHHTLDSNKYYRNSYIFKLNPFAVAVERWRNQFERSFQYIPSLSPSFLTAVDETHFSLHSILRCVLFDICLCIAHTHGSNGMQRNKINNTPHAVLRLETFRTFKIQHRRAAADDMTIEYEWKCAPNLIDAVFRIQFSVKQFGRIDWLLHDRMCWASLKTKLTNNIFELHRAILHTIFYKLIISLNFMFWRWMNWSSEHMSACARCTVKIQCFVKSKMISPVWIVNVLNVLRYTSLMTYDAHYTARHTLRLIRNGNFSTASKFVQLYSSELHRHRARCKWVRMRMGSVSSIVCLGALWCEMFYQSKSYASLFNKWNNN